MNHIAEVALLAQRIEGWLDKLGANGSCIKAKMHSVHAAKIEPIRKHLDYVLQERNKLFHGTNHNKIKDFSTFSKRMQKIDHYMHTQRPADSSDSAASIKSPIETAVLLVKRLDALLKKLGARGTNTSERINKLLGNNIIRMETADDLHFVLKERNKLVHIKDYRVISFTEFKRRGQSAQTSLNSLLSSKRQSPPETNISIGRNNHNSQALTCSKTSKKEKYNLNNGQHDETAQAESSGFSSFLWGKIAPGITDLKDTVRVATERILSLFLPLLASSFFS